MFASMFSNTKMYFMYGGREEWTKQFRISSTNVYFQYTPMFAYKFCIYVRYAYAV